MTGEPAASRDRWCELFGVYRAEIEAIAITKNTDRALNFWLSEPDYDGYDVYVDCLLGTGFQGAVRQDYRSAIAAINESPAFKISVDINSGMNGDTGEAETAAASDLTVTIGFVKHGLVTENADQYMKRLVCADIGIRLHRREKLLCFPEEAGEGNDCMAAPAWLARDVIKSY